MGRWRFKLLVSCSIYSKLGKCSQRGRLEKCGCSSSPGRSVSGSKAGRIETERKTSPDRSQTTSQTRSTTRTRKERKRTPQGNRGRRKGQEREDRSSQKKIGRKGSKEAPVGKGKTRGGKGIEGERRKGEDRERRVSKIGSD